MSLAEESVLMQYGYNVNAAEDLSAERRQKILAVLMDNEIVPKSQIISLLDFFISQRQNRKYMEAAIDKWSEDREFVEDYNPGTYTRVHIRSMQRRR